MRMLAPDVGTTFKHEGYSYRVTSWLREETAPDSSCWLDELLFESQQEIKGKKMEFCLRSEATHVGGAGIAGCIVPIDETEVTGFVPWDKNTIEEYRQHAISLGRSHESVR